MRVRQLPPARQIDAAAEGTELQARTLTDAEKAELRRMNRMSDPPVKMVMTLDGRRS